MEVIYKEPILNKINKEIYKAKSMNRKIDHVILSCEEAKDLYQELLVSISIHCIYNFEASYPSFIYFWDRISDVTASVEVLGVKLRGKESVQRNGVSTLNYNHQPCR